MMENNVLVEDALLTDDITPVNKSVDKMFNYPKNIITDIFGSEVELSEDSIATLEYVMYSKLNIRQLVIVRLRYMLDYTYADIGEMFGVTKERIRQIIARCIELVSEFKDYIITGVKQDTIAKVLTAKDNADRYYSKVIQKMSDELESKNPDHVIDKDVISSISIDELRLCNRAKNSLVSFGIKTVYDIMNMSVEDCINLHSFGTQSAVDVIYEVESRGFGTLSNFREAYNIF